MLSRLPVLQPEGSSLAVLSRHVEPVWQHFKFGGPVGAHIYQQESTSGFDVWNWFVLFARESFAVVLLWLFTVYFPSYILILIPRMQKRNSSSMEDILKKTVQNPRLFLLQFSQLPAGIAVTCRQPSLWQSTVSLLVRLRKKQIQATIPLLRLDLKHTQKSNRKKIRDPVYGLWNQTSHVYV